MLTLQSQHINAFTLQTQMLNVDGWKYGWMALTAPILREPVVLEESKMKSYLLIKSMCCHVNRSVGARFRREDPVLVIRVGQRWPEQHQ